MTAITEKKRAAVASAADLTPAKPAHPEIPTLPLLMKAEDVMRELGIGRRSVYELVRGGRLHVVRVGLRATRFRTEEVLALAETNSKPMRLPNLRNQRDDEQPADVATVPAT